MVSVLKNRHSRNYTYIPLANCICTVDIDTRFAPRIEKFGCKNVGVSYPKCSIHNQHLLPMSIHERQSQGSVSLVLLGRARPQDVLDVGHLADVGVPDLGQIFGALEPML
jgi:hypothetical protein